MNYEEKYKQALERAMKLYEQGTITESLGWIFPEIKESKDEKNIKDLIDELKCSLRAANCQNDACGGGHEKRIALLEWGIAWLEKQGKQHPHVDVNKMVDKFAHTEVKGYGVPSMIEVDAYRRGIEDALEKQCERNFDYEHADIPQKDFAPIEPKFKVGEWVVYDHIPYQVVELPKEGYINLGLRRNGKVEFAPSPYCRHWTIQDARDGDLIYVSTEKKGIQAIFHEYKNDTIFFHCYLCTDFVQGGCMPIGSVELTYPLQKTHYNRFFEKMHEAGWEWDQKKAKLIKIKEPKFKVGDWVVKQNSESFWNGDYVTQITNITDCDKHWLNIGCWVNTGDIRLWTIQDAKRGDVLVDVYGNIGIFDKCYDFDWMSSCSLGNNGGFQYFIVEHENEKTYPASKEQRDLFFSKIKEEGLEWDSENKELKRNL